MKKKNKQEVVRPTLTDPCYVGLDLSLSSTGFCLKSGGYHDLRTLKTTPAVAINDLERYWYIRDRLMEMIPPDTKLICVEDFFIPRNPITAGAACLLIQMGTIVREELYKRGLPFYVVTTTSLKKFCTGANQKQKGMIIKEVYKKWDVDAHDDNSADATVLAYMAQAIHTKSCRCQYEKDVIDAIIEAKHCYNIK
jgi:crossover junction endodeoxyribonuclease RuvC